MAKKEQTTQIESTETPKIRVYTNALKMERAKQDQTKESPERAKFAKNRIARAHEARVAAIALVAKERDEFEIVAAALAKLGLNDVLELEERVEQVASRREPKNKQFLELTGQPA